MKLFLSRATLKREPSIAALARLLLPDDDGERAEATHRLVWSLFADDTDAKRDFLYRELRPGGPRRGTAFIILSRRPPRASELFDIETKPFAPALDTGDRLKFSLRANATVARKDENGRSTRSDVVMHALSKFPKDARAQARLGVVQDEGERWLRRQGESAGFRLIATEETDDEMTALSVDGYALWQFRKLGPNGRIAVLDFEGLLEVTDPAVFLERIATGIGRARSYGCGLILVKRA